MAIRIDEDALFRAVTAADFKLLAYHLNLETGEIAARTLRPEEVAAAPEGPSVKPLPKLGGDLAPTKDALPFGPAPAIQAKKNLFKDDDLPKKPALQGDFWARDEKKKSALFNEDFKRESGSKKLAEIFGAPAAQKAADPFAKKTQKPAKPEAGAQSSGDAPPPQAQDPRQPRIPTANEAEQLRWMQSFARECGDPEIREQLNRAFKGAKPGPAFERTVRRHQRLTQQWERYYRKCALAFAEAWLSSLDAQWELSGTDERR